MNSNAKHFKNELGNSIEIEVSEKDISGVAGVLISITGPASTTDIHITKAEAEALQEELGKALHKT